MVVISHYAGVIITLALHYERLEVSNYITVQSFLEIWRCNRKRKLEYENTGTRKLLGCQLCGHWRYRGLSWRVFFTLITLLNRKRHRKGRRWGSIIGYLLRQKYLRCIEPYLTSEYKYFVDEVSSPSWEHRIFLRFPGIRQKDNYTFVMNYNS